MSSASIRLTGGGEAQQVELQLEDALPTTGDILLALQLHRSRILQRTERGVDAEGNPFAPYNNTRPFYYYPAGKVGKKRSDTQLKRDKSAVKRFAGKVGRTKNAVSRSGLGLRFPSYEDFKLTYLGRGNVDLRGPRAPHMLQAIVTQAGSLAGVIGEQSVGLDDFNTPATEGRIGIYGDEAKRASGLNSENRPKGMPQRKFLYASEDDKAKFAQTLETRIAGRIYKKLAGS